MSEQPTGNHVWRFAPTPAQEFQEALNHRRGWQSANDPGQGPSGRITPVRRVFLSDIAGQIIFAIESLFSTLVERKVLVEGKSLIVWLSIYFFYAYGDFGLRFFIITSFNDGNRPAAPAQGWVQFRVRFSI